jgi:4-hydroxy-tetrahydrodipicolinate synthase
MTLSAVLRGVIPAIPTPLAADYTPDIERLKAFATSLLEEGCHAINLLGTTGEATSFDTPTRRRVMEGVAADGKLVSQMMVGTGACAMTDAVSLTRLADDAGFRGVLVLPPFYFKGLTQSQLADWMSGLLERAPPRRARLYLYNYPQLTGHSFEEEAIGVLRQRHGDAVAGLKDSSGNVEYAARIARAFPGFAVFPSNEATLEKASTHGFAGCISASVNLSAALARAVYDSPADAGADGRAQRMNGIRTVLTSQPSLVSAVKAAVAHLRAEPAWRLTAPPLQPCDDASAAAIWAQIGSLRRSGQP